MKIRFLIALMLIGLGVNAQTTNPLSGIVKFVENPQLATIDTTATKLIGRKASDGRIVRYNWGQLAALFQSGGSTPSLQEVINAGSTATTSNPIVMNGQGGQISLNNQGVTLISGNGVNTFYVSDTIAKFYSRAQGIPAIHNNELATLGQVNTLVSGQDLQDVLNSGSAATVNTNVLINHGTGATYSNIALEDDSAVIGTLSNNLKVTNTTAVIGSPLSVGAPVTEDDAVRLQDLQGYIPLSGTVSGAPVTGDIEVNDGVYIKPSEASNLNVGTVGKTYLQFTDEGKVVMVSNGTNTGGLFADADFSPYYLPNSFVQKSWVQSQIASAGVGTVTSITSNNGVTVDNTNPAIPIIGLGNITPASVTSMNGTFISDLIVPTIPVGANSAVSRNYLDNALTGLTWKQEVRVKTTGNITLSGTQTVDGVSLAVNDRVLVGSQTNATQNGIYVVASGAWTRALDADTSAEIGQSAELVRLGTLYKNTQWTCTNTSDPVIGTDNITFGQLAGAGTYTNGNGITLTANVFAADPTYISTATQTALNGKEPTQSGTGVVTKSGTTTTYTPVSATPTSGSADILTSGGAFTALAGKATIGGDATTATMMIGTTNSFNLTLIRNNVNQLNLDGSYIRAFMPFTSATVANGVLSLLTTGVDVTRTQTTGVAFTAGNTNASNTGDLFNVKNSTGVVGGFRSDGRGYGSNATASNDFVPLGQVQAALIPAYSAKTASYTLTATDYTVTLTSGTATFTLPTAVGITGKIYIVKNKGAGVLTIATTSSQTMDGATTATISTTYAGRVLQSNGTNWDVIGLF